MSAFEKEEYARRVAAARHRLRRDDLSALLIFARESHYYLFAYDGGDYVFFQCAVLTAQELPVTLLCRRPDVAQARDTSTIEDVRVWLNAHDANPAEDLRAIVEEKGLADDAIEAVHRKARPGVLDSTLTTACLEAMLAGGGDVPPMIRSS